MLLNDMERTALEAKINQHPKVLMLAAEKERRQREIAAAAVKLDSDAPWIAARVMSGKELILEKQLIESGIECFVPVRKGVDKKHRGRIFPAEMIPIMVGYVLVRCPISAESLHGVLGFENVINFLGGNEKPYLVQTAMVKLIKGKAQSGAYDWDKESTIQLKRGMRVRIVEGLFSGAIGVVIQTGKKGDAVLEIEFLGGRVPALIPLAMLENL